MTARLVLATSNPGKAVEVRAALPGVKVEILADHPEVVMPPEDGDSFEAIALAKAEHVARVLSLPALADDSGLVVDALDGAPGIQSARYAPGTDADRVTALLRAMEGIETPKRQARFVCAMAFVTPRGEAVVEVGRTEGRILDAPRGDGGFGYDPIFLSEDGIRTTAELSLEEKNRISHRGRALERLRPMLKRYFSLEQQ